MPIYLKFGSVLGDAQESGHTNWIELSTVGLGIDRPVSNPAGSVSGRALAAPRFAELTVTKDEDVATIPLIQAALEGKPIEAQIDFARTGPDPMEVYYSISMHETLITNFAQSSSGERPVESVTFNFTKIAFQGVQMAPDGKGTSPARFGWDVHANQST
jgi:type VI secretion system secreted protein Hcp